MKKGKKKEVKTYGSAGQKGSNTAGGNKSTPGTVQCVKQNGKTPKRGKVAKA